MGSAFSVRLRAPNTGSLDISQYYRALVERAFEGGYNFLHAFFASDTCQQMNRVVENIHELGLIQNDSFYHSIDVAESYGLPADLCPLPPLEAGCAIEDDYPKMGCCFISSSMPCDGSIMTTTLQDRRSGLPTYALNVLMRWTRDDVQEYAVEELKACIAFMEEHTGERYDYDRLRDACEIMNQQTRLKMEKWEMNLTDTPPHTGSTVWLYRIFTYQCACGDPYLLKNDQKVNALLRKTLGKRTYPKTVRHRAVIWNTPANIYPNFSNWISDCWGVECVCDMIDHQGSMIIDTTTVDTMLAGIAKMAQASTTKGGYHVIMDDLWVKVEEYNADLIIMFDQISCKGVAALKGLFEEQARAEIDGLTSAEQLTYLVGTGHGRSKVPFADENISELICHAMGAMSPIQRDRHHRHRRAGREGYRSSQRRHGEKLCHERQMRGGHGRPDHADRRMREKCRTEKSDRTRPEDQSRRAENRSAADGGFGGSGVCPSKGHGTGGIRRGIMKKLLRNIAIAAAAFFGLTFLIYWFNLDTKLVKKLFPVLTAHYDGTDRDKRL